MSHEPKQSGSPRTPSRNRAAVDVMAVGETALVTISGLVDERFTGFGDIGELKTVVLNVSGLTRITSYGVQQWLRAMQAMPKTVTEVYLLGCPTSIVDQLNMVMNFGGAAKVLTVVAPYTCPPCEVESEELIDVLADRATLAKGIAPERRCSKCGGYLQLDDTLESYFGFATKYAASSLNTAAAQLLASFELYRLPDSVADRPPKVIKLVHGTVTYFRIIGTVAGAFRSRPFLVGIEGEVVLDLAEVERFDPLGVTEWRRMLKNLSAQVPAVTLVDVTESFLAVAGDSLALARNIAVASIVVPYGCTECGRTSRESTSVAAMTWPVTLHPRVCTMCGGTTQNRLDAVALAPLQKASTSLQAATAKVVAQRDEILSRALTNANVAQAGETATATVEADDTILSKYKIVRRISAGGMAEVFLAKQVGIGGFEKPVALKRIQRKVLDSGQQAIELFLNEAKIAGRLMHPNIVQVLDVGEAQGALYLAMEYVPGKDLRTVLRRLQRSRATLALGDACFIVREIAQALDHAYWANGLDGKRLSVVHRDVSPHNVMLGYDGSVKLLDFGVATSSVTEHDASIIVGKWLYMSPEATRQLPIDHQSDLFSLGVVLYMLCTGESPFPGTEPKEIVRKIRDGVYKPVGEAAPHAPPRLAALVKRMLEPRPENRPQRGQEVAAELLDIMREHGIESSNLSLSRYLAAIFPREATGDFERPAIKIMRAQVDDRSADRSTGSAWSPGILDDSQTLRRSSQSIRATPDPSRRTPDPTRRTPDPTRRTPDPTRRTPDPTRSMPEPTPLLPPAPRSRVLSIKLIALVAIATLIVGGAILILLA